MRQEGTLHTPQPSVSAALMAARHTAGPDFDLDRAAHDPARHKVRLPGDGGGHSLAQMAERDLDAALQLLADRAQYITGAGGAAIALRRDERNDMLCRASAGEKAPELGALLSTESGLSGESVRTRMPLRCDDTKHDPRVNQESCRELGIASVMIVPILGGDVRSPDRNGAGQVLGVFELFSGRAGAFAERDLSALQRLGEMVETAVKLAHAAPLPPLEMTPDAMGEAQAVAVDGSATLAEEEPVLEVELEDAAAEPPSGVVIEKAPVVDSVAAARLPLDATQSLHAGRVAEPSVLARPSVPASPTPAAPAAVFTEPTKKEQEAPAKRPVMWSAVHASPDAPRPFLEPDQSHVPPMLRNLRKCKACGFPVSEGRTLCVECDEKQWRGQPLPTVTKGRGAGLAVDFRQGGAADLRGDAPSLNDAASGRALSAASGAAPAKTAPLAASSGATPSTSAAIAALGSGSVSAGTKAGNASSVRMAPQSLEAALAELREQESRVRAGAGERPTAIEPAAVEPVSQPAVEVAVAIQKPAETGAAANSVEPADPKESKAAAEPVPHPAALNFSGGLEGSESWIGANKYILGAILLIAGAVAAVVWLR